MKLRSKILLSFSLGSILPLATLGVASFYQDTQSVKELAFSHAQIHADLFANTITVEPPLSSAPLFRQPDALQQYVRALHSDQDLDIVVVDRDKHILADVVERNVGKPFTHDTGNEVEQTIGDGIPRSFVEISVDYPDGITIIVVPIEIHEGSAVGAVLVESLPGQEAIFERMGRDIAAFISTALPGKIPSILENRSALHKLVQQFGRSRGEGEDAEHGTMTVVDAQGHVLTSTVPEKVAWRIVNRSNGAVDQVLRDGRIRNFEFKNADASHVDTMVVAPIASDRRIVGAVILHALGTDQAGVKGAEKIAAFFANSIAFAPRQKVASFFSDPSVLQEYVLDFHNRQNRDLVVVDHTKIILADAIAENVGSVFEHDDGDEVSRTIADGRSRTFVEKSVDYPQGIQQVVVPVRDQRRTVIGAVILEFSGDYAEALATITKTGWIIAGLVIGLAALIVLVAHRVGFSISRPVRLLQASAAKLAQGDLGHRATVDSRDEVGDLAIAFNDMASQLAKSRDELEQRVEERTRELKAAQAELVRKERLAAVGQVTATVSHELRNPLGAIRSASDVIRKLAGDGNPQLTRAMALLERSQVRCDKVITDLLDFTRVRELDLTSTRVDDWLGALLDEYKAPPDIMQSRELVSGAETAIDHDRLDRALRNLMDNACHAMANGAGEESKTEAKNHTLTVASRLSEGRLEISIVDSGSGIAPDDKARIFEPLFSTKSFGVGLGLPMVKQIAEQHGGGIEIQSEVGRGTEVVLWLPLPEAEEGAAA